MKTLSVKLQLEFSEKHTRASNPSTLYKNKLFKQGPKEFSVCWISFTQICILLWGANQNLPDDIQLMWHLFSL